MSVIRSIEIRDKKQSRQIRLFPDAMHLYWDAYVRDEHQETTVYYQMHLTTVLDLLYRAGVQGKEAVIQYKGGDNVELQQQLVAKGAGDPGSR